MLGWAAILASDYAIEHPRFHLAVSSQHRTAPRSRSPPQRLVDKRRRLLADSHAQNFALVGLKNFEVVTLYIDFVARSGNLTRQMRQQPRDRRYRVIRLVVELYVQ